MKKYHLKRNCQLCDSENKWCGGHQTHHPLKKFTDPGQTWCREAVAMKMREIRAAKKLSQTP